MRLICPNCDAQYEVDASAIPPEGRDVQCSNCGHGWLQIPAEAEENDVAPASDALDQDEDDAALGAALNAPMPVDESSVQPPPDDPPPIRRTLDESVLSVLREEAEREAIARRSDATTLEMQGDLGLPPPVNVGVSAAVAPVPLSDTEKRVAAMKGQPVPPPKPAARRDLLPDIEEINSTLSPSKVENRRPYDDDDLPDLTDHRKPRSGFRSGFVLMLVLAGIGTAVYIMAPQISKQIPGAADAMTAYVSAVDAARVWLDGLIQQATGALNGLTKNGG